MADIFKFYFSSGTGGILGGAISATEVTETEGDIFPNVTMAQVSTGITQYASIYIKNVSGSSKSVGVYFHSLFTVNNNIYVAKGITAGQSIANATTAPADNLIWTKPVNDYSPLSLGTLANNATKQLWLRRVITKGSAGSVEDYFILTGVQQ